MLELLLALSLTLLTFLSFVANIVGLPGNWIVVSMAAGAWWLASPEQAAHVGTWPLLAILTAALLGELLEFAAGAWGASRVGGSKRGTVLAICGSVAGAIAGLGFGNLIPIPLLGPVIASLLLGASGAFGGAILGERWAGKDWEQSIEVGTGAFRGKLLGTVGKAICGSIACCIFLVAIWF